MAPGEAKAAVVTGADGAAEVSADGKVRPKKLSARKLQRLELEARWRVLLPGSTWKRRDGTVAHAGPRYGE